MNRKELRSLEEKMRMVVMDELFDSERQGRQNWVLDRYQDVPNVIDYLEPTEIVWNRQSGDVTFLYEDGTKTLMCSETAIWLMKGAEVFLTGKPTCWQEQPRMEEPENGQT